MWFSIFKNLNYANYESEQRDLNYRLTPESQVQNNTKGGKQF